MIATPHQHLSGHSPDAPPRSRAVTEHPLDPLAQQEEILRPLVRVLEEAADDGRWCLIGGASCRLQGVDARAQNLEFMTTVHAVQSLAEMLNVETSPGHGALVDAERLHFMRRDVPIFCFGSPVFHGNYDALSPADIPSLWDARVRIDTGAVLVLVAPLEWELLLAHVLGMQQRIEDLLPVLRRRGFDGRLLTRLMREGRVSRDTEEGVWALLEAT